LLRVLPPLIPNLRKRAVKRPKVYWRDSGLLHSLLGVKDRDELLSRPQAGASWEGFVIEQIIGALAAADKSADAFYWRTAGGREIDLILDFGGEKWAVEIKLTSAPDSRDLAALNAAADIIGAKRRFLVSQTPRPIESGNAVSCNLQWLAAKIAAGALGRKD
jgi:predicted AAA+ superfamily ATPase